MIAAETAPATTKGTSEYLPYYILFFISGIPALLYQIVWERALFTIYGVNIESVTITVTAFMAGLGIGSIAGGRLSAVARVPLLDAFGVIEIATGLFGLFSLNFFHRIAGFTAGGSTAMTGLATMSLLIVPTLLMGSTLPLLVAYCTRFSNNVGQSVGALYSVNTFGSAASCLLATLFIMQRFGQSGSVRLAATLNFVVGGGALLSRLLRTPRETEECAEPVNPAPAAQRVIPFGAALVLAAVVGFISLAYEIVWYRLYSFVSAGTAASFPMVLAFYLGGIGYGSLVVHDFCSRPRRSGNITVPGLAAVILWAGIAGFLVAPAAANAVRLVRYWAMLPLVFVGATLLGAVFPLLSHASIRVEEQTGRRLSYIYLANIVGSASGSYAVGFVMMDYWGVQAICVFLLLLGTGAACVLLVGRHGRMTRAALVGVGAAVVLASCSGPLFSRIYDKLLYKSDIGRFAALRHVVENRSGVIAVSQDATVFGGGVYDGRFNTDLLRDTNGIVRAFAIAGFHPKPAEALMIGLSSGSWAQVVANHPEVRSLTIVEINPGYLSLIPKYPQVAPLLDNPKVKIVIDDGRRWLVRNPERKFDLVVMNTTYNWRSNVSNLLSIEFLKLVRSRLNAGGVLYYNATHSAEVFATGTSVFPFALRVASFLAVSDSPLQIDRQRWERLLTGYRIDGRPVLDMADSAARSRLAEVLDLTDGVNRIHSGPDLGMEGGEGLRRRVRQARIITDDNMGTEWN